MVWFTNATWLNADGSVKATDVLGVWGTSAQARSWAGELALNAEEMTPGATRKQNTKAAKGGEVTHVIRFDDGTAVEYYAEKCEFGRRHC